MSTLTPSYALQCNLEKQDCAQLYPLNPPDAFRPLPFTDESCVLDPRLEGMGRCGWPGARCFVQAAMIHCAFPLGISVPTMSVPVLLEMSIYHTIGPGTLASAAGAGAYVDGSGTTEPGIDFEGVHCASGVAVQNSKNATDWRCALGPILAIPTPTPPAPAGFSPSTITSSSSVAPTGTGSLIPASPIPRESRSRATNGAIVDGAVGGGVAFILVLVSALAWYRRKSLREEKSPRLYEQSNDVRERSFPKEPPVHNEDVSMDQLEQCLIGLRDAARRGLAELGMDELADWSVVG